MMTIHRGGILAVVTMVTVAGVLFAEVILGAFYPDPCPSRSAAETQHVEFPELSAGSKLGRAQAVGSFSRQTGMSCTSCHTQPPRLTGFGRDFKAQGFTMTTAETMEDDDEDMILAHLPVSARLRGDLHYDQTEEAGFEMSPADASRLYISGRVTDQIGIHVAVLDGLDAQVTVAEQFDDWTVGFTGGRTGPGRSDIYDTISRGLGYPAERNLMNSDLGDRGPMRAGALRQRGTGGQFYTRNTDLVAGHGGYIGAGLYDTTDDQGTPDEPYVRAVYEPPLFDGAHIGGFWISADERDYQSGSGTDAGTRYGADAAVQAGLGDDWLVDMMGAVVFAENRLQGVEEAEDFERLDLVDTDVSHRGWFAGPSLHWNELAFGFTYGEYDYQDEYATEDGVVGPYTNRVVNPFVSWMFAPNARLGFDVRYVQEGAAEQDWAHGRIRYDIGF